MEMFVVILYYRWGVTDYNDASHDEWQQLNNLVTLVNCAKKNRQECNSFSLHSCLQKNERENLIKFINKINNINQLIKL